jgi:hypothetical protein
MADAKTTGKAIDYVNDFASYQQQLMLFGLAVFGIWLIGVLYFWTKSEKEPTAVPDEC